MNHIDKLNAAYEAGWVEAACWAKRDDLMADIESAAYIADREAHLDSIRAALAQPEPAKSSEVSVEEYLAILIDRGPEPLQRLGSWLGEHLDEDDWKTAERMLFGVEEAFLKLSQPEPTAQILADRLANAVIAFATPESGDVSDIGLQPEPVSPAKWQPIETAPKDGTLIVVLGHHYGDPELGQHHCIATWFNDCWMEASDWNPTSNLQYLTHWTPLPLAAAKGGAL